VRRTGCGIGPGPIREHLVRAVLAGQASLLG
jgi:hypothetical protein